MSEEHDSFEDEEDHASIAEAGCGSRGRRQCDLAGSEYCDFCCPFHDEIFPKRAKS